MHDPSNPLSHDYTHQSRSAEFCLDFARVDVIYIYVVQGHLTWNLVRHVIFQRM